MERIVLRHLSGSKVNQVEEFPLDHFKELNVGRDPSSTVKYDPDHDDLVGRQHARITRDSADLTQFFVEDLNSRNGTYVNRQRITGRTRVVPGDIVQFGPGGPEFQFDLDPRPDIFVQTTQPSTLPLTGANQLKSTREALKPTREAQAAAASSNAASAKPVPSDSDIFGLINAVAGGAGSAPGGRSTVGKATVERMIAETKHESRKQLLLGAVALLALIGVAVGAWAYFNKKTPVVTSSTRAMNTSEIAKTYTNTVVYLEVGWHLIWSKTGGQIYHQHIANEYQRDGKKYWIISNQQATIPAYVLLDDKLEPKLTINSQAGVAIGGEHSGSGFVVTSDGFILTNAHVAASWKTGYFSGSGAPDGVVFKNGEVLFDKGKPVLVSNLPDAMRLSLEVWVPADSRQIDREFQGGFGGRHDYLDVTFPKNQNRIPAKLARVSDKHDVAMLKIDLPEPLNKAEIYTDYSNIKPGDAVTVLGYPGASPKLISKTGSRDVFTRSTQERVLPDPTVASGNIGRVLRGQEAGGGKDEIFSWMGDSYQLSGNFAGRGNSGGPVFDDQGRVIGILNASAVSTTNIAFAVPIRYGKELMGNNPVLK